MSKKLISPVGRVSFPQVWEPKGFEDSDPEYSVRLLFPPEADLTEMKKAVEDAARAKFGSDLPKGLYRPFTDCGEQDYDGYIPGWTYVTFKTPGKGPRPGIVDGNRNEITEESGSFYAGCWARVSYGVYAYNHPKRKGVSCGLINIQKVRDDSPFGFRRGPAEEDFESVEGFEEIPDPSF